MWYAIGSAAALLTTFGFVPQVIKMWRSKSVKDVSPVTLIQFILGLCLWMAYGYHLGDPIIMASNFVGLLTILVALVLYLRYSKRQN